MREMGVLSCQDSPVIAVTCSVVPRDLLTRLRRDDSERNI